MVLVAGLLTACASHPVARMGTPEQYSKKVQTQLDEGDLRAAESTLGEMELYYPVSAPTQTMQFKLIGAYYKAAEMERTVQAARRYVRIFPDSADLDQIHYYSGMVHYDRGLRDLGAAPGERTPLHAKAAKESFAALLRCCVESRYAAEASEKVSYLDEALAQYEFGLMRADLLNGHTNAAMAKGRALIDSYPVTNAAGVAEVMLAALEKPEVLDRLLIATALPLNQDEAEMIAARTGVTIAPAIVASAADVAVEPTPETGEPMPAPQAPERVEEVVAAMAPAIVEAEPRMAPPAVEAAPVRSVAAANPRGQNRYTVQLGSSQRLATVQRYMRRLGLTEGVSYELRMVNGEPWHAATYGAYADMAAAQRVAAGLMTRTGLQDLWVRPLGAAPVEAVEPRPVMAAVETAKARPVELAKARAAGRYAIQVASELSLDSLRAEMRSMKLEGQVEFHRRVVGDRTLYSALYGVYNDIQSARADLPALQGRINKSGLWIRAVDLNQRIEAE